LGKRRASENPDLLIKGLWALGFKIARPFGDNGLESEHCCGAPKSTPKPTKTKTGRGDKKDPDRFNDWSDETVTVVRPTK